MADGPPPAKRAKKGFKTCPICSYKDSNMKKHVLTHHLPIYIDPQLICWLCKKHIGSFSCLNYFHLNDHPQANQFTEQNLQQYYGQVNYLLCTLSAKLTGTEDPKQLLQHVQENNFYPAQDPQRIPFTTFEVALLSGFQELLGDAKEPLQISPPNQVASLLHWRILTELFAQLDDQTQKELKSFDVHKQFKTPFRYLKEYVIPTSTLINSQTTLG